MKPWTLIACVALCAACQDVAPEASGALAPDATPDVDAASETTLAPVSHRAVAIPGGTTRIGVLEDEAGMPHERPAFAAEVAPFVLDRSPVTVARFRAFVQAMGFRTQAEVFGDGAVMDGRTGAWSLVPGADWERPRGASGPPARDDHPVTQVAWTDAEAFCAWDGGRLPTEVEWEHAARGGADNRSPYAWGDALDEGGRPRANTWTGTFPGGDDGADGFREGTNPVGAFGETDLGLTDMGGNVWEWTASWYGPYPLANDGTGVPTGAQPQRVQRGGSYLCHPSYCHGYRVSARSHATPESSFAHVGFRCAREA